jgi:hypothetical protein
MTGSLSFGGRATKLGKLGFRDVEVTELVELDEIVTARVMRSVAGDLSEAQSDRMERSANEGMYKRKQRLQVTLTYASTLVRLGHITPEGYDRDQGLRRRRAESATLESTTFDHGGTEEIAISGT